MAQLVHELEPATEYPEAMQVEQLEDPVLDWYVPNEQLVQALEAAVEYMATVHTLHAATETAPMAAEY